MGNVFIITNNDTVVSDSYEVIFVEGSYKDVLIDTLKILHKGGRLLSHPAPASIKMFHSPVRSILIEESKINNDSILLMENTINQYDMVMERHEIDYRNAIHYKFMDREFLNAAIEEFVRMKNI